MLGDVVVVLVGLVAEGCAEVFELVTIVIIIFFEQEAQANNEDPETAALVFLDLLSELLDANEDLDDLSLGPVDQ